MHFAFSTRTERRIPVSVCRRVPNPAMDPFADTPPAARPAVVSCQVWLGSMSGVSALHSATHLLEGESSNLIVNAHVPTEAQARHLPAHALTVCFASTSTLFHVKRMASGNLPEISMLLLAGASCKVMSKLLSM